VEEENVTTILPFIAPLYITYDLEETTLVRVRLWFPLLMCFAIENPELSKQMNYFLLAAGVPSAFDMCIEEEEDGHCNEIVKESFLRETKESCKFLDCSPGHQYLEFHLHVMCPEE
jgi:hypothetical protein